MIAQLIADMFETLAHQWKIGSKLKTPDEDDVQRVLDHARKVLYDGVIGDRIEVGGLIIEKREGGLDVYCYIGSYE